MNNNLHPQNEIESDWHEIKSRKKEAADHSRTKDNISMKKLSEIYKELGIDFKFPIRIEDSNGNVTYHERSDGSWYKWDRDAKGRPTYYEISSGYWRRYERDDDGHVTYYENSYGEKLGTPRSAKTYESKVVEVDGIKYKLTAL